MDPVTLEAISFVGFMLGWPGGVLPVAAESESLRWCQRDGLPDLPVRLPEREITVGLACERRNPESLTVSPILWTWIQGSEQERRALAFVKQRGAPSLAVRVGQTSQRLLAWMLREPMPSSLAETANRRLSYALRAPMTTAAPHRLWIPLPGTVVKGKRKTAVEANVTRMDLCAYDSTRLLRGLREPPAKDAWRQRQAAA